MLKSLAGVALLFVTVDVVVSKQDYFYNPTVKGWLKLHAVPATWQEAFISCHYEGAVLASPINKELANAMRDLMIQSKLDSPIYIGVNAFSQGDFFSIEGVPEADLSITWGTYGQGNKPDDCLTLSTDEKTYISSCTLSLPYICYRKRDNTTISTECGTFDDDYQLNRDLGSCYKIHKEPKTWYRALKICAAEGGHLVIINDQREADFVTSFMKKPSGGSWGEPAHVGFRDWNREQTWLTIHGEKLENVYHTWAKGQPNVEEGLQCGRIWTTGDLDDVSCLNKHMFICEKDPHTSRYEEKIYYDFDAMTFE